MADSPGLNERAVMRPLERGDEAFLWNALYHALHVPPGEPPPDPEIVRLPELSRYVAGWMQGADDLGFMALDGDVPIGAAWLRRWSGRERGFGFVNPETPELSMALLPEFRGQGVGTMLLRRLLSAAAARFPGVSLSVSESNPARRLYEREGFRPVGQPAGGSITMLRRF